MNSFSAAVREKLGHYVYLYIDPRTEKIFYVGKGYGNRAFFHLKREDEGDVAARIAEIRNEGYEPQIDILAHGFGDTETALRVEAAAIDLLDRDQLLNAKGGFESREFGRYPVDELVALYDQTPIKIRGKDRVLLIRVNQYYYAGISPLELYEITRGVWKMSMESACRVQYAFAIFNNVVREVYEVQGWFEGGKTAYFTRYLEDVENVENPTRIEFVGRIAPDEVRERYLLKSVSGYFKQGNQNPIRYVNCE